jgi:N-acetylneuraminic acid mutarotase
MSRILSRMAIALAAILTLAPMAAFAQSPGRWLTQEKFAPNPNPEEEYWNAVANGKLYLMGGNQGGKNDRVLEYDLATDKWTTKRPAPWSANHMALGEYRGHIFVFGGATQESQPNALKSWEYDPAADSWKELAPMPDKRTAAVALESGGKFYVIGGSDEANVSLATNEVYDIAANKWETRKSMPTARNHPAGGVVGGKLYVIGGRLSNGNVANMLSSPTDVVEQYDPATDAWKTMTKMPYATSGQGWTTLQNRIYVAGGEVRDAHADSILRDFVVFDPAANEWNRLPSMPTARHGVVLAALGNRLHAISGHTAFAGGGGAALHTGVNEVFQFAPAGSATASK